MSERLIDDAWWSQGAAASFNGANIALVFHRSLFFSLVALLAAQCAGQSELPRVEPTVVTVTGEAMPLSAVPSSVVVLSRETIENSRAENVGDVLRQVPFLYPIFRLLS